MLDEAGVQHQAYSTLDANAPLPVTALKPGDALNARQGGLPADNRISLTAFNGLLLAMYFIPVWGSAALKIVIHPVRGLFDGPNLAMALYVSNNFQLVPSETLRFAWMLALAKIVVVAFFIAFVVFAVRRRKLGEHGAQELLGFALIFAGIISIISMILAVNLHELALQRLHATESLMLVGASIVMLIEGGLADAARKQDDHTSMKAAMPN